MKTCPECDESRRFPDEQTCCDIHGLLLIKGEELEPGTIIGGKYRIERLLGRGGMGHVYLATDLLLDQRRALKFLSARVASDHSFVKRFLREARAAVRVDNTNVARIFALEQQASGAFFICMEYVPGPGLRELLDKNPNGLPVDYAISLVRGIAQGLRAAHCVSLVHRDIKPENILLSADLQHGSVPKIVDFGIVAWVDEKNRTSVTHRPILTPQYASPEQFLGVIPAAELDGRTDLYALGVVFFEMLTGRLPFEKTLGGSSTYEQWLNQHCTAQPLRPSSLRPELADWPGLDELVLSLLAKEREQRPASAAAFLAELEAVTTPKPKPAPKPEPVPEPAPKPEPPHDDSVREAPKRTPVEPDPEPPPVRKEKTEKKKTPAVKRIIAADHPGENLGRLYANGRWLLASCLAFQGVLCLATPWAPFHGWNDPRFLFSSQFKLNGVALLASAIVINFAKRFRVTACWLAAVALVGEGLCSIWVRSNFLIGFQASPFLQPYLVLIAALITIAGLELHRRNGPNRWFRVARFVFAVAALAYVAAHVWMGAGTYGILGFDLVYYSGSSALLEGLWWWAAVSYLCDLAAIIAAAALLVPRFAATAAAWLAGVSAAFIPLVFLYRLDDYCGSKNTIGWFFGLWMVGLGLAGGALAIAAGSREVRTTSGATDLRPAISPRKRRLVLVAASLFLGLVLLHGLTPLFFYQTHSEGNSSFGDFSKWLYSTLYTPEARNPARITQDIEGAARDSARCASNNGQGCSSFADFYRRIGWNRGRADHLYTKANSLLSGGCDSGNAESCAVLGDLYDAGKGVTEDDARANLLYQRACDANSGYGCWRLADKYLNNYAPDVEKAATLYTRACTLWPHWECAYTFDSLGDHYLNGYSVAKNAQKAGELYKKACDAGYSTGCSDLFTVAYDLATGKGTAKNYALSARFFQTLCDGGNATACANLGIDYDNGEGVTEDEPKADGLYQKACDGGESAGCSDMGNNYFYGIGVSQDKTKGLELLKKGCDMGNKWGCDRLKEASKAQGASGG